MSSTTATMTTTAHYWVLIQCVCGIFHHYRPTTDDDTVLVCTRTGGYSGCGHTIRLADVPPSATGDTIAVVDGVLQYGIDPAATFTYRTLNTEYGWPHTFTARELAEFLSSICAWQQFVISPALIEAARDGVHNYESGYGLKTRIIRKTEQG